MLLLGGNTQGGLTTLVNILGKQLIPDSYQSLTVSSTAVPLPSIPEDAVVAYITVETTTGIRYTTDGTTPTTTVGHLLSNLQVLQIVGSQAIAAFKAIESSGGTSSLKITYLK